LIISIALAIALAGGIFVATRLQAPATLTAAFVLPAPTPLPEFSLIDQTGETVTVDTFRGHWDMLFFGFTHCPDICPTTLQILSVARNELAVAGHEPLPRIVLVSVDPERDTPQLLNQYLDYFGEDNLGVTGSLAEIGKLTAGLGIYFEKQTGEGEDYSVDHSAAVLIIDPDGKFRALFSGPHNSENFVNDLPAIMAGS